MASRCLETGTLARASGSAAKRIAYRCVSLKPDIVSPLNAPGLPRDIVTVFATLVAPPLRPIPLGCPVEVPDYHLILFLNIHAEGGVISHSGNAR